jgi:hypothetical protein
LSQLPYSIAFVDPAPFRPSKEIIGQQEELVKGRNRAAHVEGANVETSVPVLTARLAKWAFDESLLGVASKTANVENTNQRLS